MAMDYEALGPPDATPGPRQNLGRSLQLLHGLVAAGVEPLGLRASHRPSSWCWWTRRW